MTYTQFFLQLFGWVFIFYLHSRNLRRTELGRLKDSFLTQLKCDFEWLNKKVKHSIDSRNKTVNSQNVSINDKDTKNQICTLQIEEIVASKIAQLEEKIEHLNLVYRRNAFDPAMLSEFYSLNIFDLMKAEDYERRLNIIETSIATKINTYYTHNLYLSNSYHNLLGNYKEELLGAIFGSVLILIWTLVFFVWF